MMIPRMLTPQMSSRFSPVARLRAAGKALCCVGLLGAAMACSDATEADDDDPSPRSARDNTTEERGTNTGNQPNVADDDAPGTGNDDPSDGDNDEDNDAVGGLNGGRDQSIGGGGGGRRRGTSNTIETSDAGSDAGDVDAGDVDAGEVDVEVDVDAGEVEVDVDAGEVEVDAGSDAAVVP
jgi:hypothetical protein